MCYVERVKTDEGINPSLPEEAEKCRQNGEVSDLPIENGATLRNNGGTGTTTLKNDDYMADLDAENVYRMILQGDSWMDAFNAYYFIMNSSNTRANIFLKHISYETVKGKIFNELIDAVSLVIFDEQYHLDVIKSNYPDTYDFLMSLEDRLLTIAHYQ